VNNDILNQSIEFIKGIGPARFNVARNAGIPQAVVHRAMLLSQQMRQNKV
jgi:hypothetical protein